MQCSTDNTEQNLEYIASDRFEDGGLFFLRFTYDKRTQIATIFVNGHLEASAVKKFNFEGSGKISVNCGSHTTTTEQLFGGTVSDVAIGKHLEEQLILPGIYNKPQLLPQVVPSLSPFVSVELTLVTPSSLSSAEQTVLLMGGAPDTG